MPLFSQQYLSLCEDTTANTQIGTPRRSVKYEGNSIVVTYGFNDAIVTEDPLFENCNLLRYNGFGLIDISGKPSLPVRKDAFSLTQYSSIEIIDTSYVEIPMELGPARPPLMDSDNTTFVNTITFFAQITQINPMILSLFLAPIATELPEIFNSIIWVKESKDNIAFANLSGAIVYQASILPAIGLLLTKWTFSIEALINVILVYASVITLYITISKCKKNIPVKIFFFNGFYPFLSLFLVS